MGRQVDDRESTVQQTMLAMCQDRYGPPSRVLTLREVPLPRVDRGEVLVQVHSSSVNAMEWHLINGASGGVGTYAVQIAKWLGAEVTAVCSARNVPQAAGLGADVVIDYEKEDVTRSSGRFDAIFDLVGNHPLRSCRRRTAPGGTYLMVGGPKGDWAGPLPRLLAAAVVFAFGDARVRSFVATSNSDDLTQLAELMASGRLRSVIESRIPLTDIGSALETQGQFHARAKTVVNVEGVV